MSKKQVVGYKFTVVDDWRCDRKKVYYGRGEIGEDGDVVENEEDDQNYQGVILDLPETKKYTLQIVEVQCGGDEEVIKIGEFDDLSEATTVHEQLCDWLVWENTVTKNKKTGEYFIRDDDGKNQKLKPCILARVVELEKLADVVIESAYAIIILDKQGDIVEFENTN
jgi:hypothetical protein